MRGHIRDAKAEPPRSRRDHANADAREYHVEAFEVHEGERPRLYDAQGYSVQRAACSRSRYTRRTDD